MAYQRKTRDIFVLQSNYGYQHGWEDTTYEDTWRAARAQLTCYRENQPEYAHRVIKRRERIDQE